MAHELRHTEKRLLAMLLLAAQRDSTLCNSVEYNNVIRSLKAVMEPEDVAHVMYHVSAS